MAITDKSRLFIQLGEVKAGDDWSDYLQYGFTASDVPYLIDLVANDTADQVNGEWLAVHAWRALGQIASEQAIAPLIAQFESLVEDDWGMEELPVVMGMMGAAAIGPLENYLLEQHEQHDEYSRAMALDGLFEVAQQHPQQRSRVIQVCKKYMAQADEAAEILNGLLIAGLIDIHAIELITEIRQLYAKNCIDISFVGSLQDIESALNGYDPGGYESGVVEKLSMDNKDNQQKDNMPELKQPDSDDIFEVIDFYLSRYKQIDSILDVSELDGFFAAIVSAPQPISPFDWLNAIWGGQAHLPEWKTKKEFEVFSQATFTLYNHVIKSLDKNYFEALYLEKLIDGTSFDVVDPWCKGFLRGMNLWGPQAATDATFTESCIQSIRLFATEAGYLKLDAMSDAEVIQQQSLIEPDVRRLYKYFYKQRKQAAKPVVQSGSAIGRNDACPCGSGKKYKKCCLH